MTVFFRTGFLIAFAGLLLDIFAARYRTKDNPLLAGKNFRITLAVNLTPWRYRHYWWGHGYRYFVTSRVFFAIGLILLTLDWFV